MKSFSDFPQAPSDHRKTQPNPAPPQEAQCFSPPASGSGRSRYVGGGTAPPPLHCAHQQPATGGLGSLPPSGQTLSTFPAVRASPHKVAPSSATTSACSSPLPPKHQELVCLGSSSPLPGTPPCRPSHALGLAQPSATRPQDGIFTCLLSLHFSLL